MQTPAEKIPAKELEKWGLKCDILGRKARYFVLKDGVLYFFRKEEVSADRRTLLLAAPNVYVGPKYAVSCLQPVVCCRKSHLTRDLS